MFAEDLLELDTQRLKGAAFARRGTEKVSGSCGTW